MAVLASAAAAGGADRAPLTTSLQSVRPAGLAGASADTTIFGWRDLGREQHQRLRGRGRSPGRSPPPRGSSSPTGRRPSASRTAPPRSAACPATSGRSAGDLGGGDDTFTAQTTLPTLIGISLVSEERPLSGGTGRDRIIGGLGGDLITGGSGADALLGFGGGDLVRGESGRDSLSGGGSTDSLIGGSGRDKLHGGAARDLCNGGGGVDTAKSCNVTRKVP